MVPLFEADKEDEFEDVYEDARSLTTSGSSGRLATLWSAESPSDEFVMISETGSRTNSVRSCSDSRYILGTLRLAFTTNRKRQTFSRQLFACGRYGAWYIEIEHQLTTYTSYGWKKWQKLLSNST